MPSQGELIPVRMNRVHFHGSLAERFGSGYDLAIETPADAMRCLLPQVEGLKEVIAAGEWIVMRGPLGSAHAIDKDELEVRLGADDLHIIAAIEGAGDDGGPIKTIIGAVLIVVGVYFMNYDLIKVGAAMMLSGVSMMLAPSPKTSDPNDTRLQSFLFTGPVNVSRQGHPVPIAYGRVRVGSVVISSGISVAKTQVVFNPGGPSWMGGIFDPSKGGEGGSGTGGVFGTTVLDTPSVDNNRPIRPVGD